jgi:hypothetical protein
MEALLGFSLGTMQPTCLDRRVSVFNFAVPLHTWLILVVTGGPRKHGTIDDHDCPTSTTRCANLILDF